MTTDLIKTLDGFHRAEVLYPSDDLRSHIPKIIAALKDGERMRIAIRDTRRSQWPEGELFGVKCYLVPMTDFGDLKMSIEPTADTKEEQ